MEDIKVDPNALFIISQLGKEAIKRHERGTELLTHTYVLDLTYRLRRRAEIRRHAKDRKSVQEGKPDRISNLLEEAADVIEAICMSEYEGE